MATQPQTVTSAALKARPRATRPRTEHERSGWGLSAPFFFLYFAFLLWPVLAAGWKSLFSDSLGGSATWRGLGNYGELLGDSDFWASMWHTVLFTVISTAPLVRIPAGLALLVIRVARGQCVSRVAFFAPSVLPVSVVVLIWQWRYQP